MAEEKKSPKWAKLYSCPLRAAVITTRFGADNSAKKGPLLEAQLMTAVGDLILPSHWANSVEETSGPRRLKRAVLPSKVP
jgi:hypothetical protein